MLLKVERDGKAHGNTMPTQKPCFDYIFFLKKGGGWGMKG